MRTGTSAPIIADYATLCEAVLHFLDAFVNGRAGSAETLMELGRSAGVKIERKP
jgi:hypothetical protein